MARERERSREHRERERVGRQRTREKRDSSHHRVSSPRRARNKSCTETARWNSREARVRYHSNVAVSWSTEQENANDNNANFGDWIEVSRKRRKRAEENSSRVVGNGKQRRYKNLHRRDHEDVTTFYFSRFPDGTRETDLWKIFQKWGRVREVFIPKYKNKEGHKFGFVRFKEVMDERMKLMVRLRQKGLVVLVKAEVRLRKRRGPREKALRKKVLAVDGVGLLQIKAVLNLLR